MLSESKAIVQDGSGHLWADVVEVGLVRGLLLPMPTEISPEPIASLCTSVGEEKANILAMSCPVMPRDGKFSGAGSLARSSC